MSIRVASLAETAEELRPAAAVEQPVDLPDGAVLLADGSLELRLAFPAMAVLRTQRQGEAMQEERFETLRLHRLTGKDLRDSVKAPGDEILVLFAGSARLGALKARALYDGMDATDCIAVARVMRFLSAGGASAGT